MQIGFCGYHNCVILVLLSIFIKYLINFTDVTLDDDVVPNVLPNTYVDLA